jgi:hypothetical protein
MSYVHFNIAYGYDDIVYVYVAFDFDCVVFRRDEYLPAAEFDSILKNKACCPILIKESNYCPQRVSEGLYC